MKHINTEKNSFVKRFLINVPFVLMAVLMAALFGGSALLIFYSIVTAVAFNSAMIYLIVAGAAAILLGAGLGLIILFKKYYAFYNKKMGWNSENKDKNKETKQKTVTYEDKSAVTFIKKHLTLSNVSIAILALGSVFAIISAALGSIDRANWVNEVGGYRQNKGYYADVRYEIVSSFSTSDDLFIDINGNTSILKAVDTINIVLPEDGSRNKEIVVVYTKDPARENVISIEGYRKFDGDFNCSRKGNVATVDIGTAPPIGDTLDKLLFFVFNDYHVEKQILIYVPDYYRDKLEISKVDKIVEE